MCNNLKQKQRMLYATGYIKPKTTCLFCDKIIRIDLDGWFDEKIDEDDDIFYYSPFIIREPVYERYHFEGRDRNSYNMNEIELKDYLTDMICYKAVYLFGEADIIPIFSKSFYQKGSKEYVNTFVINNIPEIVEESLTWEQVIDFKEDKQSIDKIRNLKNWMIGLDGKSNAEIQEKIEKSIEDYKDSIRKHGIRTRMGAITTLMSATSAFVGAMPNIKNSILSSAITLSSGIIVYVVERKLHVEEIKKSPCALLYDILD